MRAEIAPGPVGLATLVMVGVVLDRSTPESFVAFEGAVLELKQVLDCNPVAGDFDYLLRSASGTWPISTSSMAASSSHYLACGRREPSSS